MRSPSPHESCADADGWTSGSGGLSCEDYTAKGYCFQGALQATQMGGAPNNYPERNCCDCGRSEYLGLPSTMGLKCLVYHVTHEGQHRLAAEPCATVAASEYENLGGSKEQKFGAWAIIDGLVKPVDPHEHTIAIEDMCLDADNEIVHCIDLEPFYPTHPYAAQEFKCFANVEAHQADAVCVAAVDPEKGKVGDAAHGRLPDFIKIEHEEKVAALAAAALTEEAFAPAAPTGVRPASAVAVSSAWAAGAIVAAAVGLVVAGAVAMRSRAAASTAEKPASML